MIPLKYLSKSNFGSISNTHTFTTYCDKHDTTDAWLVPRKYLSSMLTKIVTAYMSGHEFIVKVQNESLSAKNEMKIYEIINELKHPNFAELVCHFECSDNILQYNRQSSLPKGFCQGGHNKVHITIMPYYRLGNLEDLDFSRDQLSSVIGQVIMGYVEMFDMIGLVHSDLIPGNVAVEFSESRSILYEYNDVQYRVDLKNGYRTVILDFGVSSIESSEEVLVVRDLILFINKLFLSKSIDFRIEQFSDRNITTIQELLDLAIKLKFVEPDT